MTWNSRVHFRPWKQQLTKHIAKRVRTCLLSDCQTKTEECDMFVKARQLICIYYTASHYVCIISTKAVYLLKCL